MNGLSCSFLCKKLWIMEDFDMMDDDYGDLFITQSSSSDNLVSLEDNNDYRTVKDEKYSDISDFEDDVFDDKLR